MSDPGETFATPRVAAGASVLDETGRILLVHPTCQDTWDISLRERPSTVTAVITKAQERSADRSRSASDAPLAAGAGRSSTRELRRRHTR
ncbi:hypothetical protein GCM10025792_11520 [Pseudonocardia tropica]